MGGISFILATLIAYALAKVITGEDPTYSGVLVLFLMAGMGLVGFLDDYIKIVKQRSLGLRAKAKMAGQLIVGIAFAVLSLQFADLRGSPPRPRSSPSSWTSAGTSARCSSWSGRSS